MQARIGLRLFRQPPQRQIGDLLDQAPFIEIALGAHGFEIHQRRDVQVPRAAGTCPSVIENVLHRGRIVVCHAIGDPLFSGRELYPLESRFACRRRVEAAA